MTDFIPRRRARSVLTPDEYEKLCYREHTLLELPLDKFDEEDEHCVECCTMKSLGRWYDGNARDSSGSITDSLTDDSVDGGYSPLAEKHFEVAYNRGVFSEVTTHNRSARKKSYDRLYRRPKLRRHNSEKNDNEDNNDDGMLDFTRKRSVSFDSANVPAHAQRKGHHRHKKDSKTKRGDKIREKLSNSGINLLDTSSVMTLDEIHDLQQRFYTAMTLKPERSMSSSDGNSHKKGEKDRDRSVSFN